MRLDEAAASIINGGGDGRLSDVPGALGWGLASVMVKAPVSTLTQAKSTLPPFVTTAVAGVMPAEKSNLPVQKNGLVDCKMDI